MLAAGLGQRAGKDVPKQFVPLGSTPDTCPLCLTVRSYIALGFHAIYIVLPPGKNMLDNGHTCLKCPTPTRCQLHDLCFVVGGATRQESVWRAIQQVAEDRYRWVLIHDAARPFVSPVAVSGVVRLLYEGASSVNTVFLPPAAMVQVRDGKMEGLLERSKLALGQCPQGFVTKLLLVAHGVGQNLKREFADDCSLMMLVHGCETPVVQGTWEGFKITHPEDWALAQYVFKQGKWL